MSDTLRYVIALSASFVWGMVPPRAKSTWGMMFWCLTGGVVALGFYEATKVFWP